MYKNGKVCNADSAQVELMEKAGWTVEETIVEEILPVQFDLPAEMIAEQPDPVLKRKSSKKDIILE